MWRRKCCVLLKQSLSTTVVGHGFELRSRSLVPSLWPSPSQPMPFPDRGIATRSLCFPALLSVGLINRFSSLSASSDPKSQSKPEGGGEEAGPIGEVEAKRLMRLVNVEALKAKLAAKGKEKEVISYFELVEACQSSDMARSREEAVAFARILDEAGVVVIFRGKVHLHPVKVMDLFERAASLAFATEDESLKEEIKKLQEKKEEIDVQAHKQVRGVFYAGLMLALLQVGLFFRLTFWEFSWDVMEPITFYTTAAGLLIGYAYTVYTSKDPTYQNLMNKLFLIRQKKLFKKYNFDCARFKELQRKCRIHHDATASIKNRVGLEVELEDALHKD